MQNTHRNSCQLPYPVIPDGAAISTEGLPSFPAFSIGKNGRWVRVAVPVLVVVDVLEDETQDLTIAAAVEIVRRSEFAASGVPVECAPLCWERPPVTRFLSSKRFRLAQLLAITAKAMAIEIGRINDVEEAAVAQKAITKAMSLMSCNTVRARRRARRGVSV